MAAFLQGHKKTELGVVHPAGRIVDVGHRSGQAGLDRQPSARLEHAIGFSKQTRLVGDVHEHPLPPHHIEGRLLERQVQRAPVLEGNPISEADVGRQHDGGPTEFFGEVESGDPAANYRL
jgi:hypothetical protein